MLNYYNLQKAIYEKLTGDAGLMALISGVYDNAPQDADYPFITFGKSNSKKYDVLGKNGLEHRVNIEIWSRENGKKQPAYIIESLYSLLHNGSLSVTGAALTSMEILSYSINLESDGCTYHGIINLRIVLSFS